MNETSEPARPASDGVAILRVPPHSVEAEQSVLGGLMLDNLAWDRAGDLLTDSDFYRHEHRHIFGAIAGLVNNSKPADVITVFEQLQRLGKAEDCGGLAYLNELAQSVPSAANIRQYAKIVRERGDERQLIGAVGQAGDIAWSPDVTLAEKRDRVAALFDGLARREQRSAPKAMGELVARALDRYNDLAAGKRQPGMPTRFPQLDAVLGGGLRDGKLVGIAARPSVGKSSLARSIATRVARDGSAVLILSQEMPQDEQADCVLAELGRIDSQRLQNGQMADEDWGRLADAADVAKELPLHIDEQGNLSLMDIRSKARSVKGLRLLVVDYLQLCKSTLKGKTTNDEIAELSKGLKALALELGIPILVLSQLNRDVEKRADKEPQLADLRDSGAIEQDLDIALLMWTVEERDDSRIVGIKVAKHRGGRTGRLAMRFDAPVYGWTDCDFPTRAPQSAARRGI
jgi:replicative DNA helicase